MITKITDGKIICENEIITDKNLYFEDGKITAITEKPLPSDVSISAFDNYVSSGFIDIHTHGGGGAEFMDEGEDAVIAALKTHLSHGTTSIMPTTLTCSKEYLLYCLSNIRSVFKSGNLLPNFLGVHLEGPYFSAAQCGAQNTEFLKIPDERDYKPLFEEYGDIIKRVSFAPELDGAIKMCKYLSDNGVLMSIGHTNALYDDVLAAYENGARLITHFYSCMSTITRHGGFRKMGVVEAGYMLDGMNLEIIADGMHVPPELIRLILKLKDNKKITLITDSVRAAGQNIIYSFSGRKENPTPFIVEDGVAKLPDRTAFAGSVATADMLIRTMVKKVGLDISSAVKMMTLNPSRLLNLNSKGALVEGYDADIVIFDDDINIKNVFVNGKKAI